jgi:hypothetical protein
MNAMALLEAKKNMAHTIASARSLPGHRNFELPRHSDPGPASASSSHDFGQVAINPPPIATGACPLSLASPRACPFGGACHTCPMRIQTKLTINEPGDEYEQEADRVAEQVMRMREPLKQEVAPTSKKPSDQTIRRKCARCDDREALLQKKESPGQAGESAHSLEVPPSVHGVLYSPGQPLNPATRAFMEPRFGCDFSRVRVHTDAKSAESAQDMNAHAHTFGRNIVFGASRFEAGTHEGRRLLAHELAHVVKQSGSDGIRFNQGGEKRGLSPIPFREKRESVSQRAPRAAGSVVPAAGGPLDILRSPGLPLDPSVRALMESRFGRGFGHVRVHTDAQAADSARHLNARAYTVGSKIVFGAGQYIPQSTAGANLLAHELTHVVQQENVPTNQFSTGIESLDSGGHRIRVTPPVSNRGDNYERQADAAAEISSPRSFSTNTGFLHLHSAAVQPVQLSKPLPICGGIVTDVDVLPARPRPLTECGLPPTLLVTRVNVIGRARTPASTGKGRIVFNLHIGYYRDPTTSRLCGVISDSELCLTPGGCIRLPCFPTLKELLKALWDAIKTLLKAIGIVILIIIWILILRGLRMGPGGPVPVPGPVLAERSEEGQSESETA